ncbi:unnamed protein product [Linum trigynum]|uniref:Uncharacterized protein n=1 Tax=Linum trigynum TaxID=586398 RepID=A0AAV2F2I5_9ROSI
MSKSKGRWAKQNREHFTDLKGVLAGKRMDMGLGIFKYHFISRFPYSPQESHYRENMGLRLLRKNKLTSP